MDNRVGPLRVILLALLTVLILAILAGTALYLRDSMLMREGDINYNAGVRRKPSRRRTTATITSPGRRWRTSSGKRPRAI